MVTTIEASAHKANESIPVMGIRLRKDGDHTVVDAEIGGTWIEVIRERTDGQFDHIVNPSGMYARYYSIPTNLPF